MFGIGLSAGVTLGLFDASFNGFSSSRVFGDPVDAGLLVPFGLDVRAWAVFGRARLGVAASFGALPAPSGIQLAPEDVFEAGSSVTTGYWWGLWAIGAYQPQLSDEVQLWLGARVGGHFAGLPVEWSGRPYAEVSRGFFSAGPELGLRISDDTVGVMFWGFADLAQPGHAQLVVSFVFEEPKPPGAAF